MLKSRTYVYNVLLIFTFLGVLFVPFSFRYLDFHSKITTFLFEDLIAFITTHIKSIYVTNPEITSDSTTLYLLFIILFFFALIFTLLLSFSSFWAKHQDLIIKIIQLVLTYYLACIILKYGFDKIFKVQFYLPEPNILYTPVGMLDKDILFWSTMGTSYSYTVFMGLAELIPACMLLYNKTRVLGLFILLGVLINVVLVNFSFDISVKLYSSFLLLLCFILLIPYFSKIWQFFILNKTVVLPRLTGNDLIPSKLIRVVLKTTVIIFLLFESLYPYIQKKEFNDDNVPRNTLHGAYEVLKIEQDDKYKNAATLKIKRIFIHRNNYLIFQYANDTIEDFYLEINSTKNQFILTNYNGKKIKLQYKYTEATKTLELTSSDLDVNIYCKSLPWKKLPLLQPLFHWTVDGI